MKPILLFYLKIFLFTGVSFGLITIVIDSLSEPGFSWGRLMYSIAFFGGIMSLLLGTIHILSLRAMGIKKFTNANLSVHQKKQIKSAIKPENLISSLKSDPFINKMSMTENNQGILMKSDISWMSWGEKISINVVSQENSFTEYEIVSKPKLATNLVDAGKNFKNVSHLENILLKPIH